MKNPSIAFYLKQASAFIWIGVAIFLFVLFHMLILNSYFRFTYNPEQKMDSVSKTEKLLVLFVINNVNVVKQEQVENFLDEFNQNASRAHGIHLQSDFSSQALYAKQLYATGGVKPIINYLNSHDSSKISVKIKPDLWFNLKKSESNIPYLFIATLVIIECFIIFSVIFYIFGMIRFSMPLQRFKESAENFGLQLNRAHVHAVGPKIAREAASAMNQMQQHIQDLVNRRTHMLATITHDLRTPITRLKIRSYCLEDSALCEQFIPDLDEMENMISSILAFTKDESQAEPMIMFDLNALFFVVCEEMLEINHTIQIIAEPTRVVFKGRHLALKRTLNNLLQNATRYAKDISASFEVINNQAIIQITDRGPGIAEEELDKVFEPYYRGETGKLYSSVGTGLGLASVKVIVEQHDGAVTLKNHPEGGLIATIILPLLDRNIL